MMLTIMFMFFTDATTGNPSFSAAGGAANPNGYRPLLMTGMGS